MLRSIRSGFVWAIATALLLFGGARSALADGPVSYILSISGTVSDGSDMEGVFDPTATYSPVNLAGDEFTASFQITPLFGVICPGNFECPGKIQGSLADLYGPTVILVGPTYGDPAVLGAICINDYCHGAGSDGTESYEEVGQGFLHMSAFDSPACDNNVCKTSGVSLSSISFYLKSSTFLPSMTSLFDTFDTTPISGFGTFVISGFDADDIPKTGATGDLQVEEASLGLFQGKNPTATPEPATWSLMVTGFGLLGWSLRRRRVIGNDGHDISLSRLATGRRRSAPIEA